MGIGRPQPETLEDVAGPGDARTTGFVTLDEIRRCLSMIAKAVIDLRDRAIDQRAVVGELAAAAPPVRMPPKAGPTIIDQVLVLLQSEPARWWTKADLIARLGADQWKSIGHAVNQVVRDNRAVVMNPASRGGRGHRQGYRAAGVAPAAPASYEQVSRLVADAQKAPSRPPLERRIVVDEHVPPGHGLAVDLSHVRGPAAPAPKARVVLEPGVPVAAGKGYLQTQIDGERAGYEGRPSSSCPIGYEDGRRRAAWLAAWKRGAERARRS